MDVPGRVGPEELNRVCTMRNGDTYLLNLASQRVRELID